MDRPVTLLRAISRLLAACCVASLSACAMSDMDDITGALSPLDKPAPAQPRQQAEPQPPADTRTEGEKLAQAGDALIMEGRDLIAEGQARIAQGERMAAEGKRLQEEARAGHVSRERRQARKAD